MDKTVREIIGEVIDDMCMNYCKYQKETQEHLDNHNCVCDKCLTCPMNKLQ